MAGVATQQRATAGLDHERLERAAAAGGAPFGRLDRDAFWQNGEDIRRRARGKPIRVASKSLRCRGLIERVLARHPGYQGILAYTLPEAMWLASRGFDDIVVGYPTTDRLAIAELGRLTSERPSAAPALMVDCVEHLDLI